jgi:Fic family protein
VSALAAAERDLARLSACADQAGGLLHHPLIHLEAVTSLRVEGVFTSLDDLHTCKTGQTGLVENPSAAMEVENLAALMTSLDEHGPSDEGWFSDAHQRLMQNTSAVLPGELRRTQNWIGPAGSTLFNAPYVPPPMARVPEAMTQLASFIQTPDELPDLIRAGLALHQFRAIHPFLEGNDRLGRLMILGMLCQSGHLPAPVLNLSAFFERHRPARESHLLAVAQKGAWESWLAFFLRGISEQSRETLWRIEHLLRVREKYGLVVTRDRNPERMAAVVETFFTHPILTINQLADSLDLPFKTAGDYVSKCESANILREVTGFARNRVYRADAVLNALQRGM